MDFLNSVSVEIHFPLRIALLSLVKSCLLNKRLLVNNARPSAKKSETFIFDNEKGMRSILGTFQPF